MSNDLTKPIIVHDIIPEQYQCEIQHRFIGENTMPWYFTYESTQEGGEVETCSVMFHMLQFKKWGNSTSPQFDFVKPLLWQAINQAGLPFHEFLQVRAICQFPVPATRKHNLIHTDLEDPVPYYTGVYYVNGDIDGDTLIFNETFNDVPPDQVVNQYKNFTEMMRVTPRRGSAVIFSGHQYHCSSLPTKKTRCILNFSWR